MATTAHAWVRPSGVYEPAASVRPAVARRPVSVRGGGRFPWAPRNRKTDHRQPRLIAAPDTTCPYSRGYCLRDQVPLAGVHRSHGHLRRVRHARRTRRRDGSVRQPNLPRVRPTSLGDLHPLQRLEGLIVYPVRHEFTGTCIRARRAATARLRATSPPPTEAHCSVIKQYIDGQAHPL
jgi:hypothetical protein